MDNVSLTHYLFGLYISILMLMNGQDKFEVHISKNGPKIANEPTATLAQRL